MVKFSINLNMSNFIVFWCETSPPTIFLLVRQTTHPTNYKLQTNSIKTKIKSTSAFLGAYPGSSEVDNYIIPDSDTNLNPDSVI